MENILLQLLCLTIVCSGAGTIILIIYLLITLMLMMIALLTKQFPDYLDIMFAIAEELVIPILKAFIGLLCFSVIIFLLAQ